MHESTLQTGLIVGCVSLAARQLTNWYRNRPQPGQWKPIDGAQLSRQLRPPHGAEDEAIPSGLQGRFSPEELLSWPERVWGGYEGSEASDSDELAILPYDVFAACRLLDTSPDEALEFGVMFEALRTVAACYFRADKQGICDTLQAYGVSELLYDIACAKTALLSGTAEHHTQHLPDDAHCFGTDVTDSAHGSHMAPTQQEELAALMAKLMRQMECLLHEYLSFNWNHSEDLLRANAEVLRSDGLICSFDPGIHRQNGTAESDGMASAYAAAGPPPSHPQLPGSSPQGDVSHSAEQARGLSSAPAAPDASDSAEGGVQLSSGGSGGSSSGRPPDGATSNHSSASGTPTAAEGDSSRRRSGSGRVFVDGVRRPSDPPSEQLSARSGSLGSQPSAELTSAGSGSFCQQQLAHLRSRERGRRERVHLRAVRNWQRAHVAVARKVTTDMLGTQRKFRTMVEIMGDLRQHCDAAAKERAGRRQPVCLLLGGGMAAGKSGVREIIGKDVFWSKVATDAVVVEADAIKHRDVVYQQLSRSLAHLPSSGDLASEVHEFSTAAAESLFVAAINQQQDVIFDGTMMWAPFARQCIAMVRDHRHNYVRGPGYHKHEDGSVLERYWEVDEDIDIDTGSKAPYRIEIVGVTCDPGLAVARGIWRQVRTQRGVPIASQLRSHKLFSTHFPELALLADSATLYHTGQDLTTFGKAGAQADPKIIAHRSQATRGEMLVNPPSYARFCHKAHINVNARCRAELYDEEGPQEQRVCRTDPEELAPLRHAFRAAETVKGSRLRLPE